MPSPVSPNPGRKPFRCSLEDTGRYVTFSPRTRDWTCARVAGAGGDLCTCGDPERRRLCSVSQASAMFVSGSFSISGDFLQSLEISLGYCRGWFPFSRCV